MFEIRQDQISLPWARFQEWRMQVNPAWWVVKTGPNRGLQALYTSLTWGTTRWASSSTFLKVLWPWSSSPSHTHKAPWALSLPYLPTADRVVGWSRHVSKDMGAVKAYPGTGSWGHPEHSAGPWHLTQLLSLNHRWVGETRLPDTFPVIWLGSSSRVHLAVLNSLISMLHKSQPPCQLQRVFPLPVNSGWIGSCSNNRILGQCTQLFKYHRSFPLLIPPASLYTQ